MALTTGGEGAAKQQTAAKKNLIKKKPGNLRIEGLMFDPLVS